MSINDRDDISGFGLILGGLMLYGLVKLCSDEPDSPPTNTGTQHPPDLEKQPEQESVDVPQPEQVKNTFGPYHYEPVPCDVCGETDFCSSCGRCLKCYYAGTNYHCSNCV